MCARFSLTASPEKVAETFDLDQLEGFPPRYNIAPTQPILVIVDGPAGKREGVLVRWGLVPAWVKDPADFSLLVNARSETAAEKPAFRNAMNHRRALLPATGFYEWRKPAGGKGPSQPYWERPRDGGIVALGALMETWASAEGSEIDTGIILTTKANDAIAPIHPRMPVVVAPADFERWLDCMRYRPADVADLMKPADPNLFEAIPISTKVNRVANSGPDIQERVELPSTAERQEDASASRVNRAKPKRANDRQLKLF